MKFHIIYTCLFTVSLSAFSACTSSEVKTEDGAAIPIFFGASADNEGSAVSKSVFEPDNFTTPGNAIKVYDIYTDEEVGPIVYMDGIPVTYGAGSGWDYSPKKYWTVTGVHSFSAYSYTNAQDGITAGSAGSGVPEPVFDRNDGSLSVPEWKITAESQFDLMYSFHQRRMSESSPYRQVSLPMSHLLSAVSFTVTNLSGENVSFLEFSLSGVYHTASAQIPFNGTPSVSATDRSGTFITAASQAGHVLDYNVTYNIFSGAGNIGEDGYALVWPHTSDMFGGITGTIRYRYGNREYEKQIDISGYSINNWRAGTRYRYDLFVHDNDISFEVKVVPWIIDDVIIDE